MGTAEERYYFWERWEYELRQEAYPIIGFVFVMSGCALIAIGGALSAALIFVGVGLMAVYSSYIFSAWQMKRWGRRAGIME